MSPRQAHESLWLEDGSVILSMETVLFKVHRSLLTRLSPFFCSQLAHAKLETMESLPLLRLEVDIANSRDLEALLQHLYHDKPLRRTSPFGQTARILRAATQFQIFKLRQLALVRLEEIYPQQPLPFDYANWQYLHEATQLALDCKAREVLPALLYAIVTTSDFDVEEILDVKTPITEIEPGHEVTQLSRQGLADDSRGRSLEKETIRLCNSLMKRIIDHFTPILFTVPTSSHMECTGVFADHWMLHAIQPSIINSGVYKPLETLKKIQAVDWSALGLCGTCSVDKRKEWELEVDDIWSRIQIWVDLDTASL